MATDCVNTFSFHTHFEQYIKCNAVGVHTSFGSVYKEVIHILIGGCQVSVSHSYLIGGGETSVSVHVIRYIYIM